MRLLNIIILLVFTFFANTLKAQQPGGNISEDYLVSKLLADSCEARLESLFMAGDIRDLVEFFPLSEREETLYLKWFMEKADSSKEQKPDSCECNLPFLGFSGNRILVQNGRFRVWTSGADTSFTDFVRFREFVIKREAGGIVTEKFSPDTPVKYMPPRVLDSNFDIELMPGSGKLKARLNIELELKQGFTASLPLFFRYPVSIKRLAVNGDEDLGTEHRFIIDGGTPSHQCIIELTGKPKDKLTLELDYSLDFSDHALSRKQVGFGEGHGYLMPEAGWYPWFDTSFSTIPCVFNVIVPGGTHAITPGKHISVVDLPGNRKQYRYARESNTWPFIVWGDYNLYEEKINKTTIQLYLLDKGDASRDDVFDQLNRIWGEMAEMLPGSALHYQRIVEVSRHGGYGPRSNLLLDSQYIRGNNISSNETIELIAHELSHSWLNSLTEPGGKYRQFLSEGLATYLGAEVVSRISGDEEALKLWARNFKEYVSISANAIPPSDVSEDLMYSNNAVYRAVVYFKGAYFFRLLEEFSGKEGLKEILRKVLTEGDKESYTMEDLRIAAEEVNNEDYKYLFEDYLNTTCFPDDSYLEKKLDKEVSREDIEDIKKILESVFNFIDSNDVEGTISYYSTDGEFVNEKILNQVRNIVKNWKYNTQITGEPRMLAGDRNIIQCFLPVKLNNNQTETTMTAIIEMKEDGSWKVLSIKLR